MGWGEGPGDRRVRRRSPGRTGRFLRALDGVGAVDPGLAADATHLDYRSRPRPLRIERTPDTLRNVQSHEWRYRAGEIMRVFLLSVGLGLFGAATAQAKNDRVVHAPVPDWVTPSELMPVADNASGMVFVRRNDSIVHLDDQGQAQYSAYRVRILHQNALELGNLAIAWNPAAGAPTVHVVKIYRENEAIDVLRTTGFEILRREDQLEAARLDGLLTAVLRVPDLRVGDELEVGVTIRSNDPTLVDKNAGLLTLAATPAPGRFRLGLNWTEGQEPKVKMSPELAAAAKRSSRGITVSFDNPDEVSAPKDAPPRYQWQRVMEYSDFPDWASVSRHFATLFDKAAAIPASSSLRQEVKRIASANASEIDRVSVALKLVQQQVRYIYVGLDGRNLTPASAEETWQLRYGDCKGKTALLLALLSELGVEAAPVLVNNSLIDDGFDARLPNPSLFDHVIVRARIAGKDYWLDGTLPPVAAPATTPILPYRWVLPLSQQGSGLQHLPWKEPETPNEVTLYEIDARSGFDTPARVTNTLIVRGIKGLQQQVQFSGLTSAQILSAFRKELVGDAWESIEDVKWQYDTKTQASVTTIVGRRAIDWDDDGGGAKSLTLPGGGFNPPNKRVRPDEKGGDIPFYNEEADFNCYVTTVRLPTSTHQSNWSHNRGFDTRLFGRNYYRAFGIRDGAISMIRGSRVEQREITAATAKQDNARITSFDNSMASISYDPAIRRPESSTGPIVRATYEGDWTSASVPCLGPSGGSASQKAPAAEYSWHPLNEAIDPDSVTSTDRFMPPLQQIAGPNEQSVFDAFLLKVSGASYDPATTLAAADEALAKLGEPTKMRGFIQFIRAGALAGLDRDVDAIPAIEESVRLLPSYSGPLITAVSLYTFSNRPAAGADYLVRAIELDPATTKFLDDYIVGALTRRLFYAGDHRRIDVLSDRLVSSGWQGKSLGSRSGVVLKSIQRRIADGNVAGARKIVPELLVPAHSRSLLMTNAGQAVWPDVERWAGPKLSNQWKIYLKEARDRWMASQSADAAVQYLSALLQAGHNKTAIREILPLFDRADKLVDYDLIFAVSPLAGALAEEGRWSEVGTLFQKAGALWPLGEHANALNVAANHARYLFYEGRPADGLKLMDAAIANAGNWGGQINSDALSAMHRYRACMLHELGRKSEAAMSVVLATQANDPQAFATLQLCMGRPLEAKKVLIEALKTEVTREQVISFVQPDGGRFIKSAYGRRMRDATDAMRSDRELLEAVAQHGRVLPWALSDGAPAELP